jgi:hypothetical protein
MLQRVHSTSWRSVRAHSAAVAHEGSRLGLPSRRYKLTDKGTHDPVLVQLVASGTVESPPTIEIDVATRLDMQAVVIILRVR